MGPQGPAGFPGPKGPPVCDVNTSNFSFIVIFQSFVLIHLSLSLFSGTSWKGWTARTPWPERRDCELRLILPQILSFTHAYRNKLTYVFFSQGFQGKTGPPGPPGVVGPQVIRTQNANVITFSEFFIKTIFFLNKEWPVLRPLHFLPL